MNQRSLLICMVIAAAGIIPAALIFSTFAVGAGSFWIIAAIYALIIGVGLSGATGVVMVQNLRVDLISSAMDADNAVKKIGQHLTGIGYSVLIDDRDMKVTVDRNRTTRILIRPSAHGSQISVYPGLTRNGIESMFSYCAILPFCGIIALVMSYRSNRKALNLSNDLLRPTISYLEGKEQGGAEPPDPRVMVIETLLQANRLAVEAFMARYSSYEDMNWLIVLMGIIGYALIFMSTVILGRDGNLQGDLRVFLLVILLLTLATIIVLLKWNKKCYRIQSEELNEKIGYLEKAIARETGTASMSDGYESGLETLLNVCPEMPKWTRYRTRNFAYRNPSISIVIGWTLFVIVLYAGSLVSIGMGIPFLLILVGSLLTLYLVTKYSNFRSDRRKLLRWRSKIETMKADMESKLQGL
jgi:hypothetical protein